MIKIGGGTYQILEWDGVEYYRFGPQSWMQVRGCYLEDCYDNEMELEDAYQMLTV